MSSRFKFIELPLSGLYSIQRQPIDDKRGFFSRFYCAEEFQAIGLQTPIAQMNHTLTLSRGTIRGLHFQHPPHSETKVVNCLRGEVFDVAVDIRQGSPTFLKWYGIVLSAKNQTGLFIPDGFAHGFQTLTDNCELMYLHSSSYTVQAEDGINILDPMLDIGWPIPLTDCSDKDRMHLFIDASFSGIKIL